MAVMRSVSVSMTQWSLSVIPWAMNSGSSMLNTRSSYRLPQGVGYLCNTRQSVKSE